jgi:hypothetical protein
MPGSTMVARPSWTILTCLLWAAICVLGGCSSRDGPAPVAGDRQPFIADARAGPRTPAAGAAKHGKRRPEARDFKSYVLGKR